MMSTFKKNHLFSVLAGVSGLALIAGCETTPPAPPTAGDGTEVAPIEDGGSEAAQYPSTLGEPGAFSAFYPAPSGESRELDYTVIDDALSVIVFETGPSTRIRARDRQGTRAGSRRVKGHNSPYRLEGNKIFMSQFDKETDTTFREYADSLINIGNRIDITSLSRNEQLAYWFNLHNMLVIAIIAEEYPAQNPERIRLGTDRVLFHDAKVATIKGVPLSLSDIRRNIVYRYWDDPRVMYGFFHGDLGSPNILKEAYTGENLNRLLDRNAKEFVNALRGVQAASSSTLISKLYYEARPGLFPNWPSDLRRHLETFAQEDVSEILWEQKPFRAMPYPTRTADLVGGDPTPDLNAGVSSSSTPPQLVEFAEEVREKYTELRRQGRIGGGVRVIILDVPTDDPDEPEDDTIR